MYFTIFVVIGFLVRYNNYWNFFIALAWQSLFKFLLKKLFEYFSVGIDDWSIINLKIIFEIWRFKMIWDVIFILFCKISKKWTYICFIRPEL